MKPFLGRTKTLKALITIALFVAAVSVGAWLYGAYRWYAGTQ